MSQSPNDVPETYAGPIDLSTSDHHKLLTVKHRRVALDILTERVAPVDLEDLATAIAARESDGDVADEKIVEQMAISLHHTHLPMMADFGVIDYNPEATRVESCPRRPNS